MTTTVPSTASVALPLLSRGRHLHPSDGAYLLEYTSVLAGRPFSDHPRCTAPVLATLGRLVNDAVSDEARPGLALLAADLSVRPRATARATAALVAAVCSGVAAAGIEGRGDRRSRRTARRLQANAEREARRANAARPAGARWGRLTAAAHRHGAARLRLERAIRATALLEPADRDRLLVALLTTAVAAVPQAASATPWSPSGAPRSGVVARARQAPAPDAPRSPSGAADEGRGGSARDQFSRG